MTGHCADPKVTALLGKLREVKPTGDDEWSYCRRALDDDRPSLAICLMKRRILFHCHAACRPDEAVAEGLMMRDLLLDSAIRHCARNRRGREHIAGEVHASSLVHDDYSQNDGRLLYQIVRRVTGTEKTLSGYRPVGGGNWRP